MSKENNIQDIGSSSVGENPFETETDVFLVDLISSDLRLDVFLSEKYKDISRSYIQKLIKEDRVFVNTKKQKASYKVVYNDRIEISMPEPEELEILSQDIKLEIVYEDEDLLVINKPQGMVVHPAPGNPDNTLVNAVMYHCKGKLSSINGVIRPGIVHRIDKNTSGLLVVAKNNISHQGLAEQFKVHSIKREYEMICMGNIKWDHMSVDKPIGRNPKDRLKMGVVKSGGKRAVTHLEVLENLTGLTHLRATLETGRTHQIRVHTSFLNHPILGDNLYGYSVKRYSNLQGQVLHARTLGFIHPKTKEYVEFTSELPKYFQEILNRERL